MSNEVRKAYYVIQSGWYNANDLISATNLIEEISKSDLDFQLREGDKILNNTNYFELTSLQNMVNYLSDVGVDFGEGDMTGSPRTRPRDRRSSTVTLLSLGERRRGSVVSVVSTSSENVVRLRVRTNRKRRLSCTSPLSVNLPIVIVTLHQDSLSQTLAQRVDPAWEKGYKNFKFRSENLLNYFIVFSTLG